MCADYRTSPTSSLHDATKLFRWRILVVASIEETAERYNIPKPFIGLILLPIVVCLIPLLFEPIEK